MRFQKEDTHRRFQSPLLAFSLSPLLFLCALQLTGCSQSLSKAQVDRVRLGLTVTEVEDILGKGKTVDKSEVLSLVQSSMPADGKKVEIDPTELRGMRWGDDKKSVVVIFRNDKVFRVFPKGLEK